MHPKTNRLITYAPRIIIPTFILVTVLLGWQARNFTIDASAETLLLKDNRHYLITQQVQQRFNPPDFILIAFEPKSGGIFSPDSKRVLQQLTDELQKMTRVEAVNSLLNVPLFATTDNLLGGIDPESLTWASQDLSAEEMRELLTNHPLYENLLFNQQQTALALQVVFTPQPALERLQSQILDYQAKRLNDDITATESHQLSQLQEQKQSQQQALDQQRYQDLKRIEAVLQKYTSNGQFYTGGASLLAFELITIIQDDLRIFGIAVSLIVCALLYLVFREWRWVLLTVATCATSVIMTLGLLGAFKLKVTVISANVIALQIILTLAIVVHLIVQYLEEKSANPNHGHQQWVVDTWRAKVKPCFYAGLTTSIGFGSLIFSGIQPIISFGWMMVVAMAITLLVSLLLFPALLLHFFKNGGKAFHDPLTHKLLNSCVILVTKHHRWIILVWTLVFIVGISACLRLSAENSFLNYFRDTTDVHRELSYIDQKFGGSTPLDIVYTIPPKQRQESLVVTAETIQAIERMQAFLAEQKAIGSITSVVDFTRIAQAVMGKPLTEYELTALYQNLDENLQADLFSAYFSPETQQLRIATRIEDSTENLDRGQLLRTVKQGIADLGIDPDTVQYTNLFVLYEDILQRLVNSQLDTLLIVYAVMAVVLAIIFKSFKIALIALVPNVITTAFVFGLMGLFGIPLDLMTITIAAIAMGISVDDTIHYIHRYSTTQNHSQAMQQTHMSVGYAITYTTTIIAIGFAVLVFSDFMPSVYFGILTSAAMLIAVATNLTLLPWLLNHFDGQAIFKRVPSPEPNVSRQVYSQK